MSGKTDSKQEKSVALKYDGTGAPVVVAKGSGKLAEVIKRIAADNGIPVYEDHEVVEYLYRVQIGQQIPEELYEAVASIIAFLVDQDEKLREKIMEALKNG